MAIPLACIKRADISPQVEAVTWETVFWFTTQTEIILWTSILSISPVHLVHFISASCPFHQRQRREECLLCASSQAGLRGAGAPDSELAQCRTGCGAGPSFDRWVGCTVLNPWYWAPRATWREGLVLPKREVRGDLRKKVLIHPHLVNNHENLKISDSFLFPVFWEEIHSVAIRSIDSKALD